MTLSLLDTSILSIYLLVLMSMGVYFARKNTSTDEYFVAGRRLSGWVVGLSLVGTSISSITFLAYPGDAFKTSWLRYLPNLMLPIAVFIAAYFFLRYLKHGKTITAYEFLQRRFGPSIRSYAAFAFIIAQLVRVSLIMYLLALVMQEVTGLSAIQCILIGGILVALYTILGGIDAVIWTDVIQTVLLALGGIICLFYIINALPGGFSQIIDVANAANKFSFSELRSEQLVEVSLGFSLNEKTIIMMLLIGLTAWLTEYSANQNTIQRFCAARSDHEARKAMFICALVSLPIWAFYMFLGTALYVFFIAFPDPAATDMLNGVRKAEEILPFFIIQYLPQGITGLVIAAALAAAMSSLDSSINSVATVTVKDFYERIRPNQADSHYLLIARVVATIVSLIMIFGALILLNSSTKTLQDTATILTSLLSGGLLSIYLLGFFTNKGNVTSVWAGIVATLIFTAWTILSGKGVLPDAITVPFDLYYTGLIGNIVMFVVAYFVSAIYQTRKQL